MCHFETPEFRSVVGMAKCLGAPKMSLTHPTHLKLMENGGSKVIAQCYYMPFILPRMKWNTLGYDDLWFDMILGVFL